MSIVDIRDLGVICDGRGRDQSKVIAAAFGKARKERLKLIGGGCLYASQTIDARGVPCDFSQMPILTVPLDVASVSGATKDVALPPWFVAGAKGIATQLVDKAVTGVVVEAGRYDDSLHCLEQTFVVIGDGSYNLKRVPTCTRVRVKDDPSPTTRVNVFGGYGYAGLVIADNTEGGTFRVGTKSDAWAAWISATGSTSPDTIDLEIKERGCWSSYGESDRAETSVTAKIWNEARTARPDDGPRYLVRNGKMTHLIMRSRGGTGKGLVARKGDGSKIDTLILEGHMVNGSGKLLDISAAQLMGSLYLGRWPDADRKLNRIEAVRNAFSLV
ncbi:hypothetical protein KRZ98_06155 [Sphingobium sp. AS12]|uniref:hypothetical protein n=1 Tax=Sphingobium sp. AS12 TaxID=2849495 RepID=UPI001C31B7B8|nr:hypothetical protein [Sphingobium sp. AS12]MBV2147872.1 hypothetical protein [Sphingobium sp. AS12]